MFSFVTFLLLSPAVLVFWFSYIVSDDVRQAQLHAIDMDITSAKSKAYAPGTNSNLKSQWKAYLLFCSYFSLLPVPASASTICRYVMFLCHSLQTYQSVKNYLNGVRVFHLCHDYEFCLLAHFQVRLILQYAKRVLRSAPIAKLPIEPCILLRFRDILDLSSPRDASLWCCFLIAFFGFLRKSNVVPLTAHSVVSNRHLLRGHISRTSFGLQLNLSWTKTIQFAERMLIIPICAIPGSPLDPVAAYDHMCQLSPAPSDAPAFVYRVGDTLNSFTHATLVAQLRVLLQQIGLNPALYGGHSFRRGGCSFAFRSQVPVELLKRHGDWRSACYLRYLDFSLDQQLIVTDYMAKRLMSP